MTTPDGGPRNERGEGRLGLLVLFWLLVLVVGGTCAGAVCFEVTQ